MAEELELPEVTVEAPEGTPGAGEGEGGGKPLPPVEEEARRTDAARQFAAFDEFTNQSEYATLVVGHFRFLDWTSIFVQENRLDQWLTFRFSCADAVNLPEAPFWNLLQFKPGDACEIYLGRTLAMSGVIINRQAAYDARSRGVTLDGRSLSWWASTSSIVDKESRFEGDLLHIARMVLAPTGVGLETLGRISTLPFDPAAQPNPGETIGTFLERLGRERNVLVSASPAGNLLFIGEHVLPTGGNLIEGINILKCQCIISAERKYSIIYTRGQSAGGDDKYGIQASEMEARAAGTANRYRALITPMEHPVWTLEEVNLRNKHELMWTEGTDVEATIVVQGWFKPNGLLWRAGDHVQVDSPMAMLKQLLVLETVTFTQDRNAGTLTTLVAVTPWSLKSVAALTRGGGPLPPVSTPNTGPATTPPVGRFEGNRFIPPPIKGPF